jgi:hypothetical protein
MLLNEAGPMAPLAREVERIGHLMLNNVERFVLSLAMVRAAPFVRQAQPRKGVVEHSRKRGFQRALMGARLRRLLRRKDLRARIDALCQDLETLATLLLKRLPCGLTRRHPILAQRDTDMLALLCALLAPAVADTS